MNIDSMETSELHKSTEQGILRKNIGVVMAVRGSIVDIQFEKISHLFTQL